MKQIIRNNIYMLLNSLEQMEDGSYMTFIYAFKTDPWGTYKTFDIVKDGKNFKIKNRKVSKSDILKRMNRYISDDKYSTMIAVKDSQDRTQLFYNSDKNNLYEYN